MSEDKVLSASKWRQLTATIQEQERNITVLRWMIDKHLQHVSRFRFAAKTADAGYNRELEAFVRQISTARAFDAAGRLTRQEAMTMVERRAVVDGDVALLKLSSGHVQAIEADRITHEVTDLPGGLRGRNWVRGVEVYKTGFPGRARNYCIAKRDGSRLRFDRVVRALNVIFHAYRHRFDQTRGVSALAAAANTIQDLYENFDLNMIKAKLHALFGIAITQREEGDAVTIGGMPIQQSLKTGTESDDGEGTVTHETTTHVIKPGVASVIGLDTTEKIETIESRTPAAEFLAFSEFMVKVALLALDIPWIFFDALKGSYSVHRTVAIQYEKACEPKRDALRHRHDEWTVWRLWLADATGEFPLPSGWTINDVVWEWQPDGTPWIDPLDEVVAAINAIKNGLSTPQMECRKRGMDFFDNVDAIVEAQAYAAAQGVKAEWALTTDPELMDILKATKSGGRADA